MMQSARQILPFAPALLRRERFDPSSPGGAVIMAELIVKRWASVGGIVKTWVEPCALSGAAGEAMGCVRSDLRNGLPQRWSK